VTQRPDCEPGQPREPPDRHQPVHGTSVGPRASRESSRARERLVGAWGQTP
jgi:hypothetical protein